MGSVHLGDFQAVKANKSSESLQCGFAVLPFKC